jgi:biofilm PGA synthesis N-glycosyltransferase PgaC
MTLTASALVPAHNEAATIDALLEALKASTFPLEQIIVVADSCTDDTADRARRHGATVVETQFADKAKAQNVGLELVTADCIAGYDADTIPALDCIEKMMREIEDKGYDATCSTILPIQEKGLFIRARRFAYSLGRCTWRWAQSQVGKIQVLTGASYVFRTDVIRSIGGFPGGLVSADMDATWALHKAGFRLSYTGSAMAYTYDPETFKVYRSQMRRWSSGYFQTMAKYKRVWLTSPNGALVVAGALFDLCALFAGYGYALWALVGGRTHHLIAIATFLGIRMLVNIVAVTTVVGLKEALLGVGPFLLVQFYNKYCYFCAGIREWIFGKRYLNWTGRQGRPTAIGPMSTRRKGVLTGIAAIALTTWGALTL